MSDSLKQALNLSEMIKVKTINHVDPSETDWEAFDAFKRLLETMYPFVHKQCERTFHEKTGILYKWPGKSNNSQSTVLMSHYDVVPADASLWSVDPFGGEIKDGYIWGRGTLDTKETLCSILEAAEELIAEGFIPENDLYFSFSGDEEIGGPGAPAIVEYLSSKNIHPTLVIDEGGAIIDGNIFGLNKPIAAVGIGEKGYMDLELSLSGHGGHSSFLPQQSLLGSMSDAIMKLEKRPLSARLTPPTREFLKVLGENSHGIKRMLFTQLWLSWPIIKRIFTNKGGKMNALIRTTTAVTRMTGSDAFNVVPPKVTAGINFRLLDGDTIQSVIDHTLRVTSNKDIEYKIIKSWEASKIASTNHEGWHRVKSVISENWPSIIVAPTLILGGSDSRHFDLVSDCVIKFSPVNMNEQQISSVHGHDERISLSQLAECVGFYKRIISIS